MIYEKIAFRLVEKFVKKIFNDENNSNNLILTPDSINKFAELSGTSLKWRPILNWYAFEYSDQDFLEIAFTKVKPSNGQTIIVTHECFKDQMAFLIFNFKDMIPFMEVVYPNLFNMDFPQSHDFIFIQPDIELITMIHHEGHRTKFRRT